MHRRLKHPYGNLTAAQRDRLRDHREFMRGVSLMRALCRVRWPAGDLHASLLVEVRYALRENRFQHARNILEVLRAHRQG